MAIAIVVTLMMAVSAGFLIGYRFSIWKARHLSAEYATSSSSSSTASTAASAYGTHHARRDLYLPPNKLGESVNHLMVSLPDVKNEKNILTPLNNGTLPKDYKVKKVYV